VPDSSELSTTRDEEAARDELAAVISPRKAVSAKPTRAASTIHKAKGLEFDHVLVTYCGASHFPDSQLRQRLLYVAISRAVNRLVLHVPRNSPSPLIENT
jgi:superfamily I DNA/RNA helicase